MEENGLSSGLVLRRPISMTENITSEPLVSNQEANKICRIVSNRKEAFNALKSAPPGSLFIWKSAQEIDVIWFLKKSKSKANHFKTKFIKGDAELLTKIERYIENIFNISEKNPLKPLKKISFSEDAKLIEYWIHSPVKDLKENDIQIIATKKFRNHSAKEYAPKIKSLKEKSFDELQEENEISESQLWKAFSKLVFQIQPERPLSLLFADIISELSEKVEKQNLLPVNALIEFKVLFLDRFDQQTFMHPYGEFPIKSINNICAVIDIIYNETMNAVLEKFFEGITKNKS